jgi:hypothetical protein
MRISRRTTGRLLIGYAVLGFVLVVFGAYTGLELASQVERLSGTADQALSAAARATDAAAESFTAVDGSLSDAQASSDAAAALAREASGSLRSLAAAMDVTIFGTQPLQGLSTHLTPTPTRPMRWPGRSTRSAGRSATRGPRSRASVRSWPP